MRGDVYQLKAPRSVRGDEQRGNRYAVVVQSDLLPLSTWLVAPTSTSARPATFRPEIELDGKSTRVSGPPQQASRGIFVFGAV